MIVLLLLFSQRIILIGQCMVMNLHMLKSKVNKIAENSKNNSQQGGRSQDYQQGRGNFRGHGRNRYDVNFRGRYVNQNNFRGNGRGHNYSAPPARMMNMVRCFGCGNVGHMVRSCPLSYCNAPQQASQASQVQNFH